MRARAQRAARFYAKAVLGIMELLTGRVPATVRCIDREKRVLLPKPKEHTPAP